METLCALPACQMVAEMMPNPLIASIMREIMTASRMRDHAEVMRTIKGPCFDCDDSHDFGCVCRFFPDSDLACPCHGSVRDTKPCRKIDPETRPNVPPRMM